MARHEYKVVPAPRKGVKVKSAKTAEERFAHALAAIMNAEAREGWEYLRTDTLPMEERRGLTRSTTTYQNMLVFHRVLSDAEASLTPPQLDAGSRGSAPTITSPSRSGGSAPSLGPARLDTDKDGPPASLSGRTSTED